ncbi:MAG: hypothetical protein MUQ73_00620 [Schleiferiaceae bacterium]|nr:hypothetical protein [Schleiferiaceae bacterium]
MSARNILIIRIILGIVSILLAYSIYRIIMEPIEYERIKIERYEKVIENLDLLREAQLTHKEAYGYYASDIDYLEDFIAYDSVNVAVRKDSSFSYYNRLYQTDMMRDTIVFRTVGRISAIEKLRTKSYDLFGEDLFLTEVLENGTIYFDKSPALQALSQVPYTDGSVAFTMATGEVKRNGVKVPVFEIRAENRDFFADVFSKYKSLIDNERIDALVVGSLVEPTLSGNWK